MVYRHEVFKKMLTGSSSFPLFLSPSPPRFRPLTLSFARLSRSLEQASSNATSRNQGPFSGKEERGIWERGYDVTVPRKNSMNEYRGNSRKFWHPKATYAKQNE